MADIPKKKSKRATTKQVSAFELGGDGVSDELRQDLIQALDALLDDEGFCLRENQAEYYQDFCDMLTQKDKGTGRLKEAGTYSLPTGTGKTALYIHEARAALNMPERVRADGKNRKARVLVVVPTTDLLMQSALEFNKFFPELINGGETAAEDGNKSKTAVKKADTGKTAKDDDLLPEAIPGSELDEHKSAFRQLDLKNRNSRSRIGVVYGGNRKQGIAKAANAELEQVRIGQDREIIITTYESLMAESNKKLFDPRNFELVILDESHMGMEGNKPQKIREFKGHCFRVGLSATPKRDANTDAVSLTDNNMIREVTLDQAHELEAICDFNVWQVRTGLDVTLKKDDIKGKGEHKHVDAEAFAQRLLGDKAQNDRRAKAIQLYLNWEDPDTKERLFGKTGVISALGIQDAKMYEMLLNTRIYGDACDFYMHELGRPPKPTEGAEDVVRRWEGTQGISETAQHQGLPEYRQYLAELAERRAQEFEVKASIAHDRGNMTLEKAHLEMARRFRDEGIVVCKAVTSETSVTEREKILYDHKAGKVLMISGVRIPQQGLDNPRAEVLIRTDPLYSPWRVKQLGGRVLRRSVSDPADVAYTGLWDDELGDAKFARMFELKDNVKIESDEGLKQTDLTEDLSFADVMSPDFVMPAAVKKSKRRQDLDLADIGAKQKGKKDASPNKPTMPPPHMDPENKEADEWTTDVSPQKLMERSRERRQRLGTPLPPDKKTWFNDVAIAQCLGFSSARASTLEVINDTLAELKEEKHKFTIVMPLSERKVTVDTDTGISGPHLFNDKRSYFIEPKLFQALAEELGKKVELRGISATRIEKAKDYEKQHLIPLALLPVYAEDMEIPVPSFSSLNQIAATVERHPDFYYRAKESPDGTTKVMRGSSMVASFFDAPYNCRQIHPGAAYSIIEAANFRDRKVTPPPHQSLLLHDGFETMLSAPEIAKVLNVDERRIPFIEKILVALADNITDLRSLDKEITDRLEKVPELKASFTGGTLDMGGRGANKDMIAGMPCQYGWAATLTKSKDVITYRLASGAGAEQAPEGTATPSEGRFLTQVPVLSREALPFIARMLDVPPPPFNDGDRKSESGTRWCNIYDMLALGSARKLGPDGEAKLRARLAEYISENPAKNRNWFGPFTEQGPDGPYLSYRIKPFAALAMVEEVAEGVKLLLTPTQRDAMVKDYVATQDEEELEKDVQKYVSNAVDGAILSQGEQGTEAELDLGEDHEILLPPGRDLMETARSFLINRLGLRASILAGDDEKAVGVTRFVALEKRINDFLKDCYEKGDTRVEVEQRSHLNKRYYFPNALHSKSMSDEICEAIGLPKPIPPMGLNKERDYFTPAWLKTIMPGMPQEGNTDAHYAAIVKRVRDKKGISKITFPPEEIAYSEATLPMLAGYAYKGFTGTEEMPLIHKSLIQDMKNESAAYFREISDISEYQQGQVDLDTAMSWVRNSLRAEEKAEIFAFIKRLSEQPDHELTVADPVNFQSDFHMKWKKISSGSRKAKISDLITLGPTPEDTTIHPAIMPYICLAFDIDLNERPAGNLLANTRKCLFPAHDKEKRPWGRNETKNYTVVDSTGNISQIPLGGSTKKKLDHTTVNRVISSWLKEGKILKDETGNDVPVIDLATISPELGHDGKPWQDGKLTTFFADSLLRAIEHEVANSPPGTWSGRKK